MTLWQAFIDDAVWITVPPGQSKQMTRPYLK
jgi:hypothetical protein